MINLQLNDSEARVLAHLLKMAGDEYSNHGCNDFHVGEELKLSGEETGKVAAELWEDLAKSGSMESEPGETNPYFLDWLLLRHFQRRVEALLGE